MTAQNTSAEIIEHRALVISNGNSTGTAYNCTLSAAGSLRSLLGFSRSRPTAAKAVIPALPNVCPAWPRCSRAFWGY